MLSKYIKKLLLVSFLTIGLVALVGCGGSGSAGEQSDTALLNENNSTKNTPPNAYDLNITTKENTLVEFTLNVKDKDSDKLNYKILTKPQHGTLSGKAPKLTYTPKPNFIGNDSFVYIANDGEANSNKAVVNITVVAVKHTNKAPVANDDNATTSEDKNVTIDILANDIDSDGVIDKNSIQLSKTPTHGVAKVVNAKVVYTPSLNYSGEDSFSYSVKDNEGAVSNRAEVKITITPINDAPVAYEQNLTSDEDKDLNITLKASDEDNDTLTYTISTKPKHGTLSGTVPNIIYTPNANFNGGDSFTFKASDGKADSNEATIYINVEPVNDAPVANDDNVTTNEDTNITIYILANDTDIDGTLDANSINITKSVKHGKIKIVDNYILYSPNSNYSGVDSFKYRVKDNKGASSNEATVNIVVSKKKHINQPPVAQDDNATTNEDTNSTIYILVNDSDSDGTIDAKTITITKPVSHGKVEIINNYVLYTPNSNYNGDDSFKYSVKDNEGANSNEATVRINVIPVNDAPVARDDNATTNEDRQVTIDALKNDYDSDGKIDKHTVTIIDKAKIGSVTIDKTSGKFIYTPNENLYGVDSFSYRVKDNEGLESNIALVTVKINSINDAPVAYDENLTTTEDSNLTINLNASDEDNDTLTYTITTKPKNGTLRGKAPNLTYTPNANFNGGDSFTFKANDGKADSNEATIYINVEPVNDAPVAVAGEDVTVIRGDIVHFDGSKSYDIDGNISSYRWVDGNTTLSSQKIFEQKMLVEGVHNIKLIVTDDKNATGYDEKIVTVKPCCKGCEYPDPTKTNPFK